MQCKHFDLLTPWLEILKMFWILICLFVWIKLIAANLLYEPSLWKSGRLSAAGFKLWPHIENIQGVMLRVLKKTMTMFIFNRP